MGLMFARRRSDELKRKKKVVEQELPEMSGEAVTPEQFEQETDESPELEAATKEPLVYDNTESRAKRKERANRQAAAIQRRQERA